MLKTIVKKGSYHDSVVLMLLTNQISSIEGVEKVSTMMATPANKDIYRQSGLSTSELEEASTNDMVVVADVDGDGLPDVIMEGVEAFFKKQSTSESDKKRAEAIRSRDKALGKLTDANLVVISILGAYTVLEADRALDEGMDVFMFSDNVALEDEIKLKKKVHEKGLAVMGSDYGTGIIQGVPIAFTNHAAPEPIGIIGVSGTGIQELTTIIDRLGEGVKNAIDTGDGDLSTEVGGITMMDMIEAMEKDDTMKVLIIISKPPAKAVRNRIFDRLSNFRKPVVTLFLGKKPKYHEGNFYHAYTLDEAARLAVGLVRGQDIVKGNVEVDSSSFFAAEEKKTVRAYYSGGTLAGEAATLIKDALNLKVLPQRAGGFMLKTDGHIVADLGDDIYTQGRPHPMIDPAKRIECMQEAIDDGSTGVIPLDIMLGYGSHENMAGALLPAIIRLRGKAREEGKKLFFMATVRGIREDFQGYDKVVGTLKEAGIIVCENNKLAVHTAIRAIGLDFKESVKEIHLRTTARIQETEASEKLLELLSQEPRVINVGPKSFIEVIEAFGYGAVQYDWTPPAGGNVELIEVLNFLRSCREMNIDKANRSVITKVVASQPIIRGVVPTKSIIKELNEGKVILHAGPPVRFENMPDPVRDSCVGAALFGGWTVTEEEARKILASGEVTFIPCRHIKAVDPMGGITSANMPVFAVGNQTDGNEAYCTMNKGIGKVLRLGTYSEEVVDRLLWMRNVLGPILGGAIRSVGGLNVNPPIAKAIAVGDEFHQRNIAASLAFLKEVSPVITKTDMDEKDRCDAIKFLADTDQFFLNIVMATGKAVMDAARQVTDGITVTAMCRNDVKFGIRISGMGDEWFTAPVNMPQGLYFTGYDGEDAYPDMGDSVITETPGVGDMAMIAAPAVTRFVRTGGYEDAFRTNTEITEITTNWNPNFIIPNWNFQGTYLGIDARLVVEKGIIPVINMGIAYKVAGYGQIGAGTVHPPIACFEKAVAACARKLGLSLD